MAERSRRSPAPQSMKQLVAPCGAILVRPIGHAFKGSIETLGGIVLSGAHAAGSTWRPGGAIQEGVGKEES
jgi:hypothetical protein